jgi:hypothetical protein
MEMVQSSMHEYSNGVLISVSGPPDMRKANARRRSPLTIGAIISLGKSLEEHIISTVAAGRWVLRLLCTM